MISEAQRDAMDAHEREALGAIEAWRARKPTWIQKVTDVVTLPVTKAGEAFLDVPGVGHAIRSVIGGLVNVANNAAQWTVRTEAILAEYRKNGHTHVYHIDHVSTLSLKDVDHRVAYLAAKYMGLALAEGTAAGFAGAPGIAPDIVALVTLNLRAVGEYATYYGFNVHSQAERAYALHVLGLASSTSETSKSLAMTQLVKIAQEIAKEKASERQFFGRLIQTIAKALGGRLTKAKLAQIVPAAGAVVGGSFNAAFTAKVCESAYHLYRERFLAGKHGARTDASTGTAA